MTALRIGVIGLGAVGTRVVRQLTATDGVTVVVASGDRGLDRPGRRALFPGALSGSADLLADPLDVVVLCGPGADQVERAARHRAAGQAVVTTTDDRRCVQRLLALARRPLKGAVPAPVSHPPVVIGAGMAPGLTCLLVRAAARELETVDEIHVAKSGTGGPACARVHHHALAGRAMDWRDGLWIEREAGTGRELCWFPEPVRALDCYRADLADPLLIVPAFPGVERVTSRVAATRRDRLTSRLPMLRPPHPEGQTGAVRVEVRGTRHGARHGVVLGVSQAPAVATAAVAAIVAVQLGTDPSGFAAVGALALAADPLGLLDAVQARGLTVERFEGVDARTAW